MTKRIYYSMKIEKLEKKLINFYDEYNQYLLNEEENSIYDMEYAACSNCREKFIELYEKYFEFNDLYNKYDII